MTTRGGPDDRAAADRDAAELVERVVGLPAAHGMTMFPAPG